MAAVRRRRLLIATVCTAGALLNIWVACNLCLPGAWRGRNDFLGFYAGARLVGGPHLYDRDSVREEHLRAVGETGEIQFGRLPCFAFFLKPLEWLPYYRAAAIWEMLSAMAFLAFIALWPGAAPATRWLFCCWSLPAFVAVFGGQDDLILLLWIALSARLLRAGKPFSAGMVLALCSSKFHLFLLVPVVLLAQCRWRVLCGVSAGLAALLAISFGVAGPTWPWNFYQVLADVRISAGLSHMPNLHSMVAGAGQLALPVQIAATLALAAGMFLAARAARSLEAPLGVALMAGVLVGFHGYLADGALFLPGLMALSSATAAYARWPSLVLATPIPWALLQLPTPIPAVAQLLIVVSASAGMVWLARSPARGLIAQAGSLDG
jgi:hypothetical protein